LYKLKIDPLLFYHFLISVGVRDMYSDKRGEMYLKHGPLKFTNDDVKKMQDSVMMVTDKLFKTTNKEALAMNGMTELSNTIWSMQIAAASNNCTVHHFSCEGEIPDDYWEDFIKRANNDDHERRKLVDARITSHRFI